MKPRWNFLCCAALAVLSACATTVPPAPLATVASASATGRAGSDALTAIYERSIRAAAVRDPSFAVDLRTIGATQHSVAVGTFTEHNAPPSPTQWPIWVSLPDQLRALCRGKSNAVLAIQQALGLPPQATPSRPERQWHVYTFTVARDALFRPCPGGTDIAAPRCGNKVSDAMDESTARFLLDQLWSSDRVGFRAASGAPDWGYPFTGMGWTYNWDPQAPSPIGVSEFVVRKGSVLSGLTASTPAEFCRAASGS